ncbi:MAG: family 43 glycosylhydrolase [Bryobacteraceae bacterium]
MTRNRRRVLRVIASILFCASAFGQHAVIREYAALAPTADATPLQPLLESTTKKAEGPYTAAYSGNHPFVSPGIDASLFQDTDGTPYFLWLGCYLRQLNRDLSGFAGPRIELLTVDGEQVGYEGIFMCKIGQWYVLTAAEWNGGSNHDDGTYDMMYAVSKSLLGPYSHRRAGVPHGGHSTMFQDAAGNWYLAFFGNDRTAPFRASAGVAPLEIRDTASDLTIQVRDQLR